MMGDRTKGGYLELCAAGGRKAPARRSASRSYGKRAGCADGLTVFMGGIAAILVLTGLGGGGGHRLGLFAWVLAKARGLF